MWPWKRSRAEPAPREPSSGVAESIADLRAEVRGLRREVDDMDESLRSFKGRMAKRDAPASVPAEAAPADGAAVPGTGRPGRQASVAALRAAGRWPL